MTHIGDPIPCGRGKPKKRDILRAWVRQQKEEFTLGEARDAYIAVAGGRMKKKDGYDILAHMIGDIVTHEGTGPRGGPYSFSVRCRYIGADAEARNERKAEEIRLRTKSLWDRMK